MNKFKKEQWIPKEGEMVYLNGGEHKRKFMFTDSSGNHWVRDRHDKGMSFMVISIKQIKSEASTDFMKIMGYKR